jgi:hypothetical protein
MFAVLLVGRYRQGLAFTLPLDFDAAHSRLQFQKRQLRIAELLAAWTILSHELQSQTLFQNADFQLGPLQLLLELFNLLGFGK